MKKIFLAVCLLCFFTTVSFAHVTIGKKQVHNVADTTTRIIDIGISTNNYLKGLRNISTFSIFNNTLFIINGDKLVEVNLQNGAVSQNDVVTNFLKKQPKDKNFVSKIRVTPEGYYLTIFKDLYRISTAGEVTKLHSLSRFYEGLYVLNDKLIVGSIETVELINKNGQRLQAMPFPSLASSSGYVRGENGLYYSGNSEDSVLEFQSKGNGMNVNSYPPLSELVTIKEPFLSYVTDKYFVAFSYLKRNTIYIIKKDIKKNEVYKTISVKGVNLTPTASEMQSEEGYPNLKIDCSNYVYYILSLIKGKLKVLSFKV